MKSGIIFLITGAALIFQSCEKILDKDPQDKLSIEQTFRDFQGTRAALAGAYSSLRDLALYQEKFVIYPELIGGNINYSKTTNVHLLDEYNLTARAEDSEMNASYQEAYSALGNINNILAYAGNTADATQQQKNRILADALSLRALLHFNLVSIYAKPYKFSADASHPGIVLALKPRFYNDPLPVRATVAETYDAIIKDLEAALQLYENSTSVFSSGNAKTYFNKRSAEALLARVFLYKGDWEKAYQYADNVISSNEFTLVPNGQYAASWSSRTPSSESVFEISVESTTSGTTLGSFFEDGSNFQMYATSDDLLNLYNPNDVRGKTSLFRSQTVNGTLYYFTRKYEKGGPNATGVKVIRLPELYLIRAEAAAHLNNFPQVNSDLNAVRKRANPAVANLNIQVEQQAVDSILLERRRELAFEGHLLYDLTRNGKGISRLDCNATICDAPAYDNRLVMPLPKKTTDVNPKIQQNEDY